MLSRREILKGLAAAFALPSTAIAALAKTPDEKLPTPKIVVKGVELDITSITFAQSEPFVFSEPFVQFPDPQIITVSVRGHVDRPDLGSPAVWKLRLGERTFTFEARLTSFDFRSSMVDGGETDLTLKPAGDAYTT